MSNPGMQKRMREKAQKDRQAEKERRKKERREQAPTRPADGEDPDIAGIVPGPQPVAED